MNIFFGSIYSWFLSLFGQDLSFYLWGYDPTTKGYSNPNIYNHVGLATLTISLVLVIIFYYVINHPRYCKWWSWLPTLLLNSVIGLFVGFGMVHAKYANGEIPQDLMYRFDDSGNVIAYLITDANCWGFGIANMFVAAIFFIVLSFLLKWGSSNAKHVPFL